MIDHFPFLPEQFTSGKYRRDFSWVNEYVQDQLDKNLPTELNRPITRSALKYNVQETHRSLFARIRLPKQISPYQVKILLNHHMLRLKLPSGKVKEIPLKKQVEPKRSRARFTNGILEIQMPIVRNRRRFHEVFVDN